MSFPSFLPSFFFPWLRLAFGERGLVAVADGLLDAISRVALLLCCMIINEIVRGQRSITADTALRLARFFRTTERFWLNLQTRFDLELEKDRLGDRLDREVTALAVQVLKVDIHHPAN